MIISLTITFNICFGCSKEPSHRDGSFEYPQQIFLWTDKIFFYYTLEMILLLPTMYVWLAKMSYGYTE